MAMHTFITICAQSSHGLYYYEYAFFHFIAY
jgi:hypothetical protein